MLGQHGHFKLYAPERVEYALERYRKEAERLYEVLDRRLAVRVHVCGEYSIADIANWCWVRTYKWSGVPIDGLPGVRRWMDAMKERPACRRGIEVPVRLPNMAKDEEAAKKFAENAQKSLQT